MSQLNLRMQEQFSRRIWSNNRGLAPWIPSLIPFPCAQGKSGGKAVHWGRLLIPCSFGARFPSGEVCFTSNLGLEGADIYNQELCLALHNGSFWFVGSLFLESQDPPLHCPLAQVTKLWSCMISKIWLTVISIARAQTMSADNLTAKIAVHQPKEL